MANTARPSIANTDVRPGEDAIGTGFDVVGGGLIDPRVVVKL